ncbi:MAG: response regulator [Tunicatimonas sp.]
MFQYKPFLSTIKRKPPAVKKGRVLVVDDDVAMRTILVSVLNSDFEVEAKKNGMEAMLWLSEGNVPDVIVSDIMMPQLNGYEFIKMLRQSILHASIPVLLLSGHRAEDVETESLRIGADKYLSKPFDPRIILEFVLSTFRTKFVKAVS